MALCDSATAITLPADLEACARAEVAAGHGESVEALVAQALRERRADLEYVRGKLDEARASVAAGRTIPLEAFLRRGGERVVRLRAAVKAAEARIRSLHEYDIPGIVSTPITFGATAYLNWIDEAVGGETP